MTQMRVTRVDRGDVVRAVAGTPLETPLTLTAWYRPAGSEWVGVVFEDNTAMRLHETALLEVE